MHRSASLPGLFDAASAVAVGHRHAVAVSLIADAIDRTADPRLDSAGAILLDERRAAGSRRGEAQRLIAHAARLDCAAHERRADGDYAGYVLGFQSARVLTALHFLVRDGGAALADVAYESVMVCGATEPILALLGSGSDG